MESKNQADAAGAIEIKVALIGGEGCGKTSLVEKYMEIADLDNKRARSTLEVEHVNPVEQDDRGKKYRLIICDIPGCFMTNSLTDG